MSSSLVFVSEKDFNLFHSIDRELYTILVINLWRDPVESMQVMALWLWLERMNYKDIVYKILSLPYILVNEIADEAIACLGCINNSQSPNVDIPLMQSLLEKEISLRFFFENRLLAMQGIAKIVNDVCIRALTDIMNYAIERNAAQSLMDSQAMLSSTFQQQSSASTSHHQIVVSPEEMVRAWTQQDGVPAEDRTMFVTFSKGYPVQEREVTEYFAKNFGDCIESLHMQPVEQQSQSLFARIIFRSEETLEAILNGMDKVKFSINGKHVWARKFVPKQAKSSLPGPSLLNFSPSHGF